MRPARTPLKHPAGPAMCTRKSSIGLRCNPRGTEMRSQLTSASGLLLCAVALRPLAVSFGPALPDIQRDLAIEPWQSGIIGMIPVLCLGLFAPIGVRLAADFGPHKVFSSALGVVILFGALRGAAPELVSFVLLTVGLGIGMGAAGSIPLTLIRTRRDQPTPIASVYAFGVLFGAAIGSFAMVPLTELLGSWRLAMIALSLPVLFTVGLGAMLLGKDLPQAPRGTHAPLPWKRPLAWVLALIFGLQSLLYWALVTWLPETMVGAGWSPISAGALVATLQIAALLGGLFAAYLVRAIALRRTQLAIASLVSLELV